MQPPLLILGRHSALLLALLVVSYPVMAAPDSTGGPIDSEPFSFRVNHFPTKEVINVLTPIFPTVRFREDPYFGVITADVTPDRLEPLQKVIDLLDVPRDPVELTIHLVWGKKSSFRGPVPQEIRVVESELHKRFPFGRYEVEASVYAPVLERGKGMAEIFPDYTLEYALDRVEPASGEVDLRLDVSRLSILGERLTSVLRTSQRVYVEQPCVVGGIPVVPDRNAFHGTTQRAYEPISDRCLILVIEVSLPESTPPPREASVTDQSEG
jgi:hypothetical protein